MSQAPSEPLPLDGLSLTLESLVAVARGAAPPALSADATAAMTRSREWVRGAQGRSAPIYGINTGFGSLARVRIAAADTERLSRNLIRSHAAGVGPDVPAELTRATMLLRANALARGASGCRVELVGTLLAMLARGVTPVVPSFGSCGSSGDLAPLSHLGLVVFGEGGRAWIDGEELPGPEAMARAEIPTLRPVAKEGLAMTNGAQLTTAIAALALHDAWVLVRAAELAAAMSFEALLGVTRALHPAVHALRPHPGAVACAARLRALLEGSTLVDSLPDKVQDAYSLRCTPVVVGAARDALTYATRAVEVELNSVTDNPVILVDAGLPAEADLAFSAGLFHGEPVGIVADAARVAVTEIASICERRLFRLTTGTLSSRLPPALCGDDRPNLGMLVPQTTAAALVSELKAYAWPATVDSIPTCEDQEDHVAMSTTAAWRLRTAVEAARRVVAIELLCGARALDVRAAESADARFGVGARHGRPVVARATAGLRTPGEAIEAVAAAIADGAFEGVV